MGHPINKGFVEPRPFGALPILALGADVAAAPIGEDWGRERGGLSSRQSGTTGPLSSRCSRFSSQDLLAFNRWVFENRRKSESAYGFWRISWIYDGNVRRAGRIRCTNISGGAPTQWAIKLFCGADIGNLLHFWRKLRIRCKVRSHSQ